jgi:hypothetical protein
VNKSSIAGLVLLVLVAGVVFVAQNGHHLDFLLAKEPKDLVRVTCFVGGEKMDFLHDSEVIEILQKRYGLVLDAVKAGSIEMATSLPSDGKNCLWPSNQVASELHRLRGGGVVAEETVFNSPMVLYTWDVVADALQAQGLTTEREGTLYLTDFPAMVPEDRRRRRVERRRPATALRQDADLLDRSGAIELGQHVRRPAGQHAEPR